MKRTTAAMTFRVQSLIYVSLLLLIDQGHSALLTVSPEQISVTEPNPKPSLTITCTPDATDITNVISIEIGKQTSTGAKSVIIELLSGDPIVVVDSSLKPRMTNSGSISGATGSLQIVLSQLQTSDAGTYYCVTSYSAGGGVSDDEATATVTIGSTPDSGTTEAAPDTEATEGSRASATGMTTDPTQTESIQDFTIATNVTGSTEATSNGVTTTACWALIPFLLLFHTA